MPRPRLDHVRKAQILAAAATVLSERGYANARVADIARAAGTSPAAILYWFDGKDRLLAEALALREQEFHDRYTEQLDALPTASDRLRLLIDAMLRRLRLGPLAGAVRARAARRGRGGRTRPHGPAVASGAAGRDPRRPGARGVHRQPVTPTPARGTLTMRCSCSPRCSTASLRC